MVGAPRDGGLSGASSRRRILAGSGPVGLINHVNRVVTLRHNHAVARERAIRENGAIAVATHVKGELVNANGALLDQNGFGADGEFNPIYGRSQIAGDAQRKDISQIHAFNVASQIILVGIAIPRRDQTPRKGLGGDVVIVCGVLTGDRAETNDPPDIFIHRQGSGEIEVHLVIAECEFRRIPKRPGMGRRDAGVDIAPIRKRAAVEINEEFLGIKDFSRDRIIKDELGETISGGLDVIHPEGDDVGGRGRAGGHAGGKRTAGRIARATAGNCLAGEYAVVECQLVLLGVAINRTVERLAAFGRFVLSLGEVGKILDVIPPDLVHAFEADEKQLIVRINRDLVRPAKRHLLGGGQQGGLAKGITDYGEISTVVERAGGVAVKARVAVEGIVADDEGVAEVGGEGDGLGVVNIKEILGVPSPANRVIERLNDKRSDRADGAEEQVLRKGFARLLPGTADGVSLGKVHHDAVGQGGCGGGELEELHALDIVAAHGDGDLVGPDAGSDAEGFIADLLRQELAFVIAIVTEV